MVNWLFNSCSFCNWSLQWLLVNFQLLNTTHLCWAWLVLDSSDLLFFHHFFQSRFRKWSCFWRSSWSLPSSSFYDKFQQFLGIQEQGWVAQKSHWKSLLSSRAPFSWLFKDSSVSRDVTWSFCSEPALRKFFEERPILGKRSSSGFWWKSNYFDFAPPA